MRGRGPRRRARLYGQIGPPTEEREAVERRWFARQEWEEELADLVTGDALTTEPRHRWLPYRQAFAPELVRRFLRETLGGAPVEGLLLDPFAGAGTMPIECARHGWTALGIEALPALVFVAGQKAATSASPLPVSDSASWESIARELEDPLHRAALICAVARQHTSEGKPLKQPWPIRDLLRQVMTWIQADVRSPLGGGPRFQPGDARELASIDDESIAGVLTSPPYLSRHDYTRATRPIEQVYRYWYEGPELREQRDAQLRANPKAYRQRWTQPVHPSVVEACAVLDDAGEPKLAGVVRSYFDDLARVVGELFRVLQAGASCWVVIGGTRLQDVYIPTDSILADLAEATQLTVESVRVARRLTPTGRKLGRLTDVAPRESILMLRKQ